MVSVLIIVLLISLVVGWWLHREYWQIKLRQHVQANVLIQQALKLSGQQATFALNTGAPADCFETFCSIWQTVRLPNNYPSGMSARYQTQQWQPDGSKPMLYRVVTEVVWDGTPHRHTQWVQLGH